MLPSIAVALAAASLLGSGSRGGTEAPQLLMIVREPLRPGHEEAYDRNEREIAATCARLRCPHPYLALVPVSGRSEVWWLNAFASEEEKERVEAAFSGDERLMAELGPLGRRKDAFRRTPITTVMRHRRDLSGDAVWRILGARFVVLAARQDGTRATGVVFEDPEGRLFVVSPADGRSAADRIAARSGPGSTLLAVQPRWSFPARGWIEADPRFWESNPAARPSTARPPPARP